MGMTTKQILQGVHDWTKEKINGVDETSVKTGSYDATVAVGLADNLRGDTVVDAEFYKRKTGGTQSVGSGIAAIKEIRGKSIVWNQLLKEGKLVDMGLPSGTLWASCNIDITQPDGFAASPFQHECSFFSWGNVDGHNPISNSAFDYNFGDVNGQSPYFDGQPYSETQGNTLTGNIPIDDTYDAARVNVGSLWHMPTQVEFAELLNNIRYINADGTEVETTDKRVIVNEVRGVYMESIINGARIFFPCSGFGENAKLNQKGTRAIYWSSKWGGERDGQCLNITSVTVRMQTVSRNLGCSIRPVISASSVIGDGKNGHKYALSSNNKNIYDATLMFGSGNEPTAIANYDKMFPLDYYDYNAGTIIPFAGQNLVTTGFNQWDEQWEVGSINANSGELEPDSNKIRAKNFIKVLQNTNYYISADSYPQVVRMRFYDANYNYIGYTSQIISSGNFTTPINCYYMKIVLYDTTTYNNDICINISDEDRNGTYEPYEKHTLPLDPSQWRDKNGDLVFPYGGMHGVGTAYDYAKVDADGYIRKVVRVFGGVDLGSSTWNKRKDYHFISNIYDAALGLNYVCASYIKGFEGGYNSLSQNARNLTLNRVTTGFFYLRDDRHIDAPTQNDNWLSGVMLYYELAEPIEVELATPVYAKYLVDKDGTEEITPANGVTPYTTMANLSILYAMDARGEIKNLPKNYLSKESAENMLNAMVSAGVIASYTMTWDAVNNRYAFVIQKNSEQSDTDN